MGFGRKLFLVVRGGILLYFALPGPLTAGLTRPHHCFLRHRFLTRPCSGQRRRLSASTLSTGLVGSAKDIRTFRRFLHRSMRITHAITTVLLAYPAAWKVIIFIRVLPLTMVSLLTGERDRDREREIESEREREYAWLVNSKQ